MVQKSGEPVDMVNIPIFTWFHTCQVVFWDFFHQQFHHQFVPFKKTSVLPGGVTKNPIHKYSRKAIDH